MRIRCASILLATVCLAAVASTQLKYFPDGTLDPDPERAARRVKWYSDELTQLKEPSLLEPQVGASAESDRFLWLRSFHADMCIRLDVNGDGTSRVTTKITADKPATGKAKTTRVTQVTKEQTASFLAIVDQNGFWKLLTFDSYRGLDGTVWIIEGTKGGTYHVVDRWTPKDENVRAIGFAMLNDLANLNISHRAD